MALRACGALLLGLLAGCRSNVAGQYATHRDGSQAQSSEVRTLSAAQPDTRPVAVIETVARGISAHDSAQQLAARLGTTATAVASIANAWAITVGDPAIRISLSGKRSPPAPEIATVVLYVAAGLRLRQLSSVLGAYEVTHESKTSSVQFTSPPMPGVNIYAHLFEGKVRPEDIVVSVSVSRP